jgi:hypothetical protein
MPSPPSEPTRHVAVPAPESTEPKEPPLPLAVAEKETVPTWPTTVRRTFVPVHASPNVVPLTRIASSSTGISSHAVATSEPSDARTAKG